jgi:hypothetical protein
MTTTVLTRELIPTLRPAARSVAKHILNRGLHATFNGHAWHITGNGINLHAVDLGHVDSDDLRPYSRAR